jgi:hypothetical protein
MGNSRKGYRISIGKYRNMKCRGECMQRPIDSTLFSFRLQPLYALPLLRKGTNAQLRSINADLQMSMKTTALALTTNQTLAIQPADSYFTDCIVTPQYCLSVCKNSVSSYKQHLN